MTLLDIGGGFPGHASAPVSFDAIAQVVNIALEKYFPAEEGLELIAEPGTYMVASGFTLAVNIIAKRIEDRDEEPIAQPSMSDNPVLMYYVNDGVYGSFSSLRYGHADEVKIKRLKYMDVNDMTFESSIWGQTFDGNDCILKNVQLPMHDVDEWLYVEDMGAYTIAAVFAFNGMQNPRRVYYCDAEVWFDVYPETVNHCAHSGVPYLRPGHPLQDTCAMVPEMSCESNGIMCKY